jgi:hypothetical protein
MPDMAAVLPAEAEKGKPNELLDRVEWMEFSASRRNSSRVACAPREGKRFAHDGHDWFAA